MRANNKGNGEGAVGEGTGENQEDMWHKGYVGFTVHHFFKTQTSLWMSSGVLDQEILKPTGIPYSLI